MSTKSTAYLTNKIDLKLEGEYTKEKVANKIIQVCNTAVNDGTRLHSWSWGVTWDRKNNKFKSSYHESFTWGTILGAIILYSDYTKDIERPPPKIEVAAEILGVDLCWVEGFCNGIDGRYPSKVYSVKKRKSLKGQQCRDGIELGKLLNIGYLTEDYVRTRFFPTPKEKYDTHSWVDIEENATLISMGIQKQKTIVKCSQCEMFGGSVFNHYDQSTAFHVGSAMNDKYLRRRKEPYEYSCNETLIKNILE